MAEVDGDANCMTIRMTRERNKVKEKKTRNSHPVGSKLYGEIWDGMCVGIRMGGWEEDNRWESEWLKWMGMRIV